MWPRALTVLLFWVRGGGLGGLSLGEELSLRVSGHVHFILFWFRREVFRVRKVECLECIGLSTRL